MAQRDRRKCKCCLKFFRPDPRNHHHQRHCSAPKCRAASKADSQARWLANNTDYFRGPANVARVRAWRTRHPEYWRESRRAAPALQDLLKPQLIDIATEITISAASPLQDLLKAQHAVLIGLIAHITVTPLQDDMVRSTDRLLRRGYDVLAKSATNARAATPPS